MLKLTFHRVYDGDPEVTCSLYEVETDLSGDALTEAITEQIGVPCSKRYLEDKARYGRPFSSYWWLYEWDGKMMMSVDTFRRF